MGYYFKKARSHEVLSPEQLEQYRHLRSKENNEVPQALLDRLEVVKKYIGPLYSGEIWSALNELIEDAVVTWILAGEDAQKIEWSDPSTLSIPEPPPTEEEKERGRIFWANFHSEMKEAQRIRELEANQPPPPLSLWERISNFFLELRLTLWPFR